MSSKKTCFGMHRAVSSLHRSHGNRSISIILLGFAGAKESHMQKYNKIYQERGYDTVTFTSLLPNEYTMDLKKMRDVQPVVGHLKEILSKKDTAVHTLSMNGVFTLCALELQHPELQLLSKTRGILFDSGPVDLGYREVIPSLLYANRYYKELLVSGNAEDIKNYKEQRLKQFYRLMKHYTILPIRRLQGRSVDDISAYDFLKNHPDLPSVMSFAYSKIDTICGPRTIKKFADFHRIRGRLVEELFLEDTQHVDHYRKHPQEYTQLVDSFLLKCGTPR